MAAGAIAAATFQEGSFDGADAADGRDELPPLPPHVTAARSHNEAKMNALSSIALSGLGAAQLRLGASAHNIANTQTPGFRRQLVVQASVPDGGVSATLTRAPVAGDALADDLVGQLSARYQFIANLRVIQTQDQLLGTLIDDRA